MGIKIDITTPHGVRCTYASIQSVSLDKATNSVTVCLAMFVSKETRDANPNPVWAVYPKFGADQLMGLLYSGLLVDTQTQTLVTEELAGVVHTQDSGWMDVTDPRFVKPEQE